MDEGKYLFSQCRRREEKPAGMAAKRGRGGAPQGYVRCRPN
uniref:Uncharacterized protein n=1 Tax=Arundo donax TaxID=35708 RepID=A0A0A8Z4X8_ARUDO